MSAVLASFGACESQKAQFKMQRFSCISIARYCGACGIVFWMRCAASPGQDGNRAVLVGYTSLLNTDKAKEEGRLPGFCLDKAVRSSVLTESKGVA